MKEMQRTQYGTRSTEQPCPALGMYAHGQPDSSLNSVLLGFYGDVII